MLTTNKCVVIVLIVHAQTQKIQFHKTIVVKNDSSISESSSSGNYYFDVYCEMTTQVDSDFNAFGVRGYVLLLYVDYLVVPSLRSQAHPCEQ